MGAGRTIGGMARQHETVGLHDAQHPLGVDRRQVLGAPLAVEQSRDAAIAIGRPLIDQPADRGQHGHIFSLGVWLARRRAFERAFLRLLDEVGAGNAERVGDRLHSEPS